MESRLILLTSHLIRPVDIESIEIPMTLDGWWEHRKSFPQEAGIYVLVGKKDERTVVLRIGIGTGKKGIYGRWFESQMSHYQAWREERERSASYHMFYDACARVFPTVELYFLLYAQQRSKEILDVEKMLISSLEPMWERRWDWLAQGE